MILSRHRVTLLVPCLARRVLGRYLVVGIEAEVGLLSARGVLRQYLLGKADVEIEIEIELLSLIEDQHENQNQSQTQVEVEVEVEIENRVLFS